MNASELIKMVNADSRAASQGRASRLKNENAAHMEKIKSEQAAQAEAVEKAQGHAEKAADRPRLRERDVISLLPAAALDGAPLLLGETLHCLGKPRARHCSPPRLLWAAAA